MIFEPAVRLSRRNCGGLRFRTALRMRGHADGRGTPNNGPIFHPQDSSPMGHNVNLSITALMHRAQLWTVFVPTPAPVGTGAGRTVHNYRACRNFLRSSGG
jgi:hypothetical protein